MTNNKNPGSNSKTTPTSTKKTQNQMTNPSPPNQESSKAKKSPPNFLYSKMKITASLQLKEKGVKNNKNWWIRFLRLTLCRYFCRRRKVVSRKRINHWWWKKVWWIDLDMSSFLRNVVSLMETEVKFHSKIGLIQTKNIGISWLLKINFSARLSNSIK